MKVTYSETDLFAAASWLTLNLRKQFKNVSEAEKFINEYIMQHAKENARYIAAGTDDWVANCSTRGLHLVLTTDDSKVIDVDISVTPSFNPNHKWITKQIELKKKKVNNNLFGDTQ